MFLLTVARGTQAVLQAHRNTSSFGNISLLCQHLIPIKCNTYFPGNKPVFQTKEAGGKVWNKTVPNIFQSILLQFSKAIKKKHYIKKWDAKFFIMFLKFCYCYWQKLCTFTKWMQREVKNILWPEQVPHPTWPTGQYRSPDLCTEYCDVCLTICSFPRMAGRAWGQQQIENLPPSAVITSSLLKRKKTNKPPQNKTKKDQIWICHSIRVQRKS